MSGQLFVSQWRLARIEVVNWGTFSGHHSVDIARQGHLMTGPSGSGKSSLLDAIAVVITPKKWITFNAAAQDNAASRGDRSIMSYVRGAWSKEADELEDRTVASYLRPGATWSGVLLRFEDEHSAPVTLVRLFHVRGSATDNASLRDTSVITRDEHTLLDFQNFAARGIKVRELKKALSPVIATDSGSQTPFFTRMRKLLGVSDQNALRLLHRTQAAKNLGTLDSLFRTFMLEEPGTFASADTAVAQFGQLSDAYEHVLDLREQSSLLEKVSDAAGDFETADAQESEATRLADLVGPFAAIAKAQMVSKELASTQARLDTVRQDAARARRDADVAHEEWETAKVATMGVGGGEATHLRARIDEAQARVDETTKEHDRLATRLRDVHIEVPRTPGAYAELVSTAKAEILAAQPQEIAYDTFAAHTEARKRVAALDAEITALRHRRSNIDGALLAVRSELAASMGVPETAIPFGGELIEVKEEFDDWRGAIERVLAPVATALLVRDDMLDAVRRFVDERHLGVRLVIEAVPASNVAPPRASDSRSVVNRVTVSPGTFEEYLQWRLGKDFDVACVDSPAELHDVDRGVTRHGLFKRSQRRYEKNDRREVSDRGAWMLGGDNAAKLDVLIDRRAQAQAALEAAAVEAERVQRERDAVNRRRQVLEELIDTAYERIDVAARRDAVDRLEHALQSLVRPDSDLDRALEAERLAKASHRELAEVAQSARDAVAGVEARLRQLEALREGLETVAEVAVSEPDHTALEARFRAVRRSQTLDTIDRTATSVIATLNAEARAAQRQVRDAESRFVHHATQYCDQWPSQAADLTADVRDRTGFAQRLESIVANGLPEHEENFRKLLHERSRDTLIHLNDEIMSAPRQVERRIDPVNESLQRSEYDPGIHLQIYPKVNRGSEVKEFLADIGRVLEGSFEDESLADAEKRFAVLSGIMRRLGSSEHSDQMWRKRVLDTRMHVTFLAREINAAGDVVNVHDSSAGLSGGQRQKLVVFCLAAALRYQLARDDEEVPRYGTIVLDEAFDKADSQYTRLAMDIFVEFGFHMVLATPQKLLQTLEPYIGAITAVSNPTRRESQLARVEFERTQP